MSLAYQIKLNNLMLLYHDKELPLSARHALELVGDLHDLVSQLTGRVAQLEEQVTALNQKMG